MRVLELLGEVAIVFLGHTQPTDYGVARPCHDPEVSISSTVAPGVIPCLSHGT